MSDNIAKFKTLLEVKHTFVLKDTKTLSSIKQIYLHFLGMGRVRTLTLPISTNSIELHVAYSKNDLLHVLLGVLLVEGGGRGLTQTVANSVQ